MRSSLTLLFSSYDHRSQAVTALSVDPPGARVVTGGYDYDVKLWDFGGMQADYRPFKSFEPYENYHVSGGFSRLGRLLYT